MFKALLKVVLFFFFKSSKSCQNHKQNFIVEKYHGMVLRQSVEKPLDAGAAVRFPASAPLLRFFLSSVWIPSVTAISATKKLEKNLVCADEYCMTRKEPFTFLFFCFLACACLTVHNKFIPITRHVPSQSAEAPLCKSRNGFDEMPSCVWMSGFFALTMRLTLLLTPYNPAYLINGEQQVCCIALWGWHGERKCVMNCAPAHLQMQCAA